MTNNNQLTLEMMAIRELERRAIKQPNQGRKDMDDFLSMKDQPERQRDYNKLLNYYADEYTNFLDDEAERNEAYVRSRQTSRNRTTGY